ncbi:hypothetical protein GCM10011316_09990 [Roseibium aquae]|uniref:Lysozyme inhibitor LprI-like N-terminal domain-containing protein n=1 Tax=Roseibium aquae TaxID=1323746 RepID=A0A916WYS3_9HYPH|nr:lysozyme inhibitor LprI family protein [Roseibium aquae]GGB39948.1 hypothetical protein GCM10011316_09990 [Roseibium aquae]
MIRSFAFAALVGVAFFPCSVAAQSAIDCGYPLNNAERTFCAEQALLEAETEMAAAFGKALARMEELDEPLPEHLKGGPDALRAAQEAWTDYRDKDCLAYSYPFRAGTRGNMSRLTCMIFLTRQRGEDLLAMIEDYSQ